MLGLQETIDFIFQKSEAFKHKGNTELSIFDFFTFEKVLKRKNILMGLGNHKTLDFLNLSLNVPLSYHHLTLYSNKYTKAFHDFLSYKFNLNDVKKSKALRRDLLRALNNILYLNNHLYNSDASLEDFQKNGVNFVKAGIGMKQAVNSYDLPIPESLMRKRYLLNCSETNGLKATSGEAKELV